MSLRLFRNILLVLALLSMIGIPAYIMNYQNNAVISPVPDVSKPPNPLVFAFNTKKDPNELKRKIQEAVANKWPNYSVLVKDFNSDFIMSINESVVFSAASVNKIYILAALYNGANKGNVDLDQKITVQQDDVQDYGTGIIRSEGPGKVYSIKTLAKLMMQQSDNTAAYILANHIIHIENIQNLINSWGLTQTDIANNKTSNKDVALVMSRIINDQIAKKPLTEELLSFMQNSDFEDRIPALLPKDVNIYHKIGTEVGELHDVGIVSFGKTKYYIGIFTSDITDEDSATKTIQQVSKVVFDFMK